MHLRYDKEEYTGMTLKEMDNKLKMSIESERYIHSIGVMKSALELAEIYGVEKDKAAIAGLLHDCAKDLKNKDLYETIKGNLYSKTDEIMEKQPRLLHGPIGAHIAKNHYDVTDKQILNAIKYHTTGKENMNILEKIIFISDYIEVGRNFTGVEIIRKWVKKDLDKAILIALDITIKEVINKGELLHPATVKARNYLILRSN